MPPAPAAPAAPAAAPSAPAPRSAPSTGAPAMDRQDSMDSDWLREAGAELEDLDRSTNQIRPPRPAQGPPKRKESEPEPEPEPEDRQTAAPEEQPDDVINPGDEPEPAPAAAPDANAQPERPLKAPELRKAYQESQRRIKEELEPKVAQYEARIKELETAGPKDTEQTQAKVKHLEERNKLLEDFVRLKHFEQSEEYQKDYVKPYEEAWELCLRDLSTLEIEVADGKGGYITRKANDGDITRLAQLATTNLGEYIKQRNAMFGDASDIIHEHVKRINDTYDKQSKALEKAQQRSAELAKNSATQTAEQERVRQKLWVDHNTELSTKFPTYFAPVKGDESGNKLLNAGLAFADLLFSHQLTPDKLALLPPRYRTELETKGKLSPELMVRAHAIIRNKAGNHDRLARSFKQVTAQLAEANKKLAEYEDSEPPTDGSSPGRAAPGGGHWSDDYNNEIDELARKGP